MSEYNGIAEEQLGVKTARKGTVYVLSRIVSAAATLLILIFLTRFLGPVEYGLYAIAVAFTSVLGMSGNFGLGTTTRKKLPESKEKRRRNELLSNTYSIALVGSGIITIIGIAISGYIAVHIYGNASLYLPLVVASLTVFLSVLYNVSNSVLVASDRVRNAAVCNIMYSFIQLAVIVAMVSAGYSIFGALAGLAVGLGAGVVLALVYIYRHAKFRFVLPSMKVARELLGFSVPLMVSNVAYVGIANLAIDLLGVIVAPGVIGSFGAAYKLGKTFDVILISSTFVLLPALTRAAADPKLSKKMSEIYNTSVFYLVLLVTPILVFLIVAAKYITHMLFSSAYPLSGLYFAFISIGITAQVISSFAGTLIISYGNTKEFMKYQIIGVVVEFVLLIFLIKYIAVYGAILSLFIIGPMIINYMYIRMLRREFKIRLNYAKLARIMTLGVAIWAALTIANAYIIGYISILVDLVGVMVLYPPLAAITRTVNASNISFMKKMTSGIPVIGSIMGFMAAYAAKFVGSPTKE